MTGVPAGGGAPSGFLEFFILEAGDYIEQLDRLLLHANTSGGPDAGAMQRIARALRGASTMAKIASFSDLAGAIERVGRGLHQGQVRWDPALGGALVAAVDDLKILLRAARNWSTAEDQRATARITELSRYVPQTQPTAAPSGAPAAATSATFLATEASNVAAGLELLAARAGDADTAANVLRRVRALRGVAGVKEIAPLADALEATEDAARGLELGEELSPEGRQLLEASGAYLRTLARAIRGDGGSDVNAPSAARDAFAAALESWSNRSGQRDQVVPIGHLFYDDGAMGLVESSSNPPTSSSERFRIELVSIGEHLRQVATAARGAHDTAGAVRARRDLKRAVRDAQSTAQSFGESEIAAFIEGHLDAAEHIDFLGLAALDDLANSLADAGAGGARLREHARELAGRRQLASSIAVGLGSEAPDAEPAAPSIQTPRAGSPLAIATPVYTPAIVAPIVAPAPAIPVASAQVAPIPTVSTPIVPTPIVSTPAVTPAVPTPAHVPAVVSGDLAEVTSAAALPTHALDSGSAQLIDSTIAALDMLTDQPFIEPSPWPEEALVPIDTLLYRGRAALDRALELRDDLRAKATDPSRETINELFDLIELARAE